MGGNFTQSQILSGANALKAEGVKDTACKAFKNAVKNWCRDRKAKNKKGNFNDYFFRSLQRTPPDGGKIAAGITREVPGVFRTAGGNPTKAFLGLATDAAGKAGKPGAMAKAILAIWPNMSTTGGVVSGANRLLTASTSAVQGKVALIVGRRFKQILTTRWADGMFPSGRMLEIKGPTDGPRAGQMENLKKMGGGKNAAVVSCETCEANCSKSNPCP